MYEHTTIKKKTVESAGTGRRWSEEIRNSSHSVVIREHRGEEGCYMYFFEVC